ncbi:MAG TPA: YiiX/YebB-like N1pC/P60 family cysteine hydrolase [Thermoanaerobaculia bacterium]|nr:YiiX/YebB-like N1pC/P60 family cysteine hydrolase [Thermoanaerobaculia bacterium]
MRSPRRVVVDWFLKRLTARRRRYQRFVYNEPERLKATIRPGDVLLVDGDQRVSQAIKYLTMSTWSHSAIYVGDALLKRDPAMRAEMHRRFGREARHLLVEAVVGKGVIVSPLVKYLDFNIRICRPIGLKETDLEIVLDHVISRIGWKYDQRNFWDLTRYLLPFRMIPSELREDALHFGSGRDTETICSSLLAEAFGTVHFPIVPVPVREKPRNARERIKQQILGRPTRRAYSGLLRARHPTLVVPRDFDLSPYFEIVKFNPRDTKAFDYKRLTWDEGVPVQKG